MEVGSDTRIDGVILSSFDELDGLSIMLTLKPQYSNR